jgi:hypothetical protein
MQTRPQLPEEEELHLPRRVDDLEVALQGMDRASHVSDTTLDDLGRLDECAVWAQPSFSIRSQTRTIDLMS